MVNGVCINVGMLVMFSTVGTNQSTCIIKPFKFSNLVTMLADYMIIYENLIASVIISVVLLFTAVCPLHALSVMIHVFIYVAMVNKLGHALTSILSTCIFLSYVVDCEI